MKISSKDELNRIGDLLHSLTIELTSKLNLIYNKGIPEEATKIVIWIPVDARYNLNFSYMDDEASEVATDYPEFSFFDPYLESLINREFMDSLDIEYNQFSKQVDLLVAKWLQLALEQSKFKDVKLHKVMAINNVCVYFDLNSLKLLSDKEMWD